MSKRKVILYIACSLDGYISAVGDDLSFLDKVKVEGEDYGYVSFEGSVDTIILGRRTYEWVLRQVGEIPYRGKAVYVLSRQSRPAVPGVEFYGGNLKTLLDNLRQQEGKHIFCDGGAEVVDAFLKARLIDELIISVVPVLLGDGISLFKAGQPLQDLSLLSVQSFESGLVQMHYQVVTPPVSQV